MKCTCTLHHVVYITNIPEAFKNFARMLGSDKKLYEYILNDKDGEFLHGDITKLKAWAHTWQIRYITTKWEVMYIGKDNINCSYNSNQYSNDIIMQQSDVEDDLGVFTYKDLKFDHHVQEGIIMASSKSWAYQETLSVPEL